MYARESTYMQIETTKKVMHTPEVLEMPQGEGYAASQWIISQPLKAVRAVKSSSLSPTAAASDGLADDDVVEITCTVDQSGAHPIHIGKVTPPIFSLITAVKAYGRLSVQAILEALPTLPLRR